jgi:hypothetical protein
VTLGPRGARVLKVVHLALTGVWLGCVVALFPSAFGADIHDAQSVRLTYLHLRSIAWNVIGWGGIGSLATGLAIGVFTPWGVFRHRWVIAKLLLTVYAIMFGMFFVERHMLAGLALLESGSGSAVLFSHHHRWFLTGLLAQAIAFTTIIAVAVFKPRFGRDGHRGAPPAQRL